MKQKTRLLSIFAASFFVQLSFASDIKLKQSFAANGLDFDNYIELFSTHIWHGENAGLAIIEEVATYADQNSFGWYTYGQPGDKHQIFAGLEGDGQRGGPDASRGQEKYVNFGNNNFFGFYLNSGSGDTFYTESLLNTDQRLHSRVFRNRTRNSSFILAWEDMEIPGTSDRDFNDFIVSINFQTVPEPRTLALLGLGLILIPILRRRNKTSNF